MESTPMLTLDEAVAKYVEAKDILIEYADTRREHYPDGMGWAVETLDAAVRDVALAAGEWFNDPDRDAVSLQPYFRDYIRRLLGDSPHG